MHKLNIVLSSVDFTNLRNLIKLLEDKLEKKPRKFSGTKLIQYEFILVPMLKDRYKFLYTAERLIDIERTFAFELYQAASLYYFLIDTDDLPIGLISLKASLRQKLKDFLYSAEKTAFQIYYEEEIQVEWHLSFTEMRDEYPDIFNYLQKKYENRKNKSITNTDGLLEKPS